MMQAIRGFTASPFFSFAADNICIAVATIGVAFADRALRVFADVNMPILVVFEIVCAAGAGLIMLRRRFVGD